jgi:hypothetical protein
MGEISVRFGVAGRALGVALIASWLAWFLTSHKLCICRIYLLGVRMNVALRKRTRKIVSALWALGGGVMAAHPLS